VAYGKLSLQATTIRFTKEIDMLCMNKSAVGPTDRLSGLAPSLGRPVSCNWLSLSVADAALLLATDRESDIGDLLDTWRALCAILRQELATARPLGQGQVSVSP
jgi:hypothetical protein